MAVNEFEEFRKQYESTYIRIKFNETSDYQVVFVTACVSDTEKSPYFVVRSPTLGQCTVNWKDSKLSLDYTFPVLGLFNYDNSFYCFHRFPDRQWKRGISSGNSHVSDPLSSVKRGRFGLGHEVTQKSVINTDSLTAAFTRHPISLSNAVELLNAKKLIGVALNSTFGITLNPTINPNMLLWKHMSMIGYVHQHSNELEVIVTTFEQEVSDFLNRQKEYDWNMKRR